MTDLLPPPPSSWRERVAALRDGLPLTPATIATAVLALVAVAVVGFAILREPGSRAPVVAAGAGSRPAGNAWTPPTTEAPTVVVHVAGAVIHPGIQRLAAGSRTADAITAAGGPSPDADLDVVNLAAKVGDGDRVYVPRKGEVPAGAGAVGARGATTAPAVLDLKAATADQLDTLPGIGPATAQAIVTYRTEHGRFRSIDGLLAVRGIGPSKLNAIRSRLRI